MGTHIPAGPATLLSAPADFALLLLGDFLVDLLAHELHDIIAHAHLSINTF